MLNIPKSIINLIKKDGGRKYIRVHFPNGEAVDNDGVQRDIISYNDMVDDSFTFTESINSGSALSLQLVETPSVEFTLGDWGKPFKGAKIIVTLEILCSSIYEGAVYKEDVKHFVYVIPYGVFRVKSCDVEADLKTRKVIAYADGINDELSSNYYYTDLINIPWYDKKSKVNIYMDDIQIMYTDSYDKEYESLEPKTIHKTLYLMREDLYNDKIDKLIGLNWVQVDIDVETFKYSDYDMNIPKLYFKESKKKGECFDLRSFLCYRVISSDFAEYMRRIYDLYYTMMSKKIHIEEHTAHSSFIQDVPISDFLLISSPYTSTYGTTIDSDDSSFRDFLSYVFPITYYKIPKSYMKNTGSNNYTRTITGYTGRKRIRMVDRVNMKKEESAYMIDSIGVGPNSEERVEVSYEYPYPAELLKSSDGVLLNRFMWELNKDRQSTDEDIQFSKESFYSICSNDILNVPKKIKVKFSFIFDNEYMLPIDPVEFELDCSDILQGVDICDIHKLHQLKNVTGTTLEDDKLDKIQINRDINTKLKCRKYKYTEDSWIYHDPDRHGYESPIPDISRGRGTTGESVTNKKNYFAKHEEISNLTIRSIFSSYAEFIGKMAKINREGKIEYFKLNGHDGLEPSTTLYPSEDLFPKSATAGTFMPVQYQSCWYDDSGLNRPIGRVACYYKNKDVFEDKKNTDPEMDYIYVDLVDNFDPFHYKTYLISDNWFIMNTLYTRDQIEQILKRIGSGLTDIQYTPCEIIMLGRPELESGDFISVLLDDGTMFKTIIFRRTISGADYLEDDIECEKNDEDGSIFVGSGTSGGSTTYITTGGGESINKASGLSSSVKSVNGLTGNVEVTIPTYSYDPETKTLKVVMESAIVSTDDDDEVIDEDEE